MSREDHINEAWNRGYEAGLSGKTVPCPYDSPWRYAPWISGYVAGSSDARAPTSDALTRTAPERRAA